MKFLTIQRACMGSISIPLDRVSSISAHGNVSRVDYARADGTLDYTFDDRAPFAVLHEIDALCAHAPAADAPLRGFIEVTVGIEYVDVGGARIVVPVSAIRGLSTIRDGAHHPDSDCRAWLIIERAALPVDLPLEPNDRALVEFGVSQTIDEIKARLAGATR